MQTHFPKNNPPRQTTTYKVSSNKPELSQNDLNEIKTLVQGEQQFYHKMGMAFISDMLA